MISLGSNRRARKGAPLGKSGLWSGSMKTLCAGLLAAALPLALSGCGGGGNSNGARAANVLYTESNDPAGNKLLAYSRAADGSLTPLAGFPFDLKGQGLANPTEAIGPADSDQQIITDANHQFVFAVNPGSNSIAVMRLAADGTLTHVPGSPFASGGVNPVSLLLLGNKLYCANKNVSGAGTPNYTVFTVGTDGTLTPFPGATINSPTGSSAAQILASPDGTTLFTNDFLAPAATPAAGSLRSYHVNPDGSLTQIGAALTVPVTPPPVLPDAFTPFFFVTQGVQVHPMQRIFYACVPFSDQIAIFTYDTTGTLTFNSFVPTSGALNCWILINKNATRMYVVSTGDNSVETFDVTSPLAPVELQHLTLKDSGPTFTLLPIHLANQTSSAPAEEALDPGGLYLYVVSHHSNPDPTFHGGNLLHVLRVAADGTLTEPGASVDLDLTDASHAQGLLVL